jgi:hypothetical protein
MAVQNLGTNGFASDFMSHRALERDARGLIERDRSELLGSA